MRAAVTSSTQAVIVEPLQGEGGIRPLTPDFARALKEVCKQSGALLIADEIQCGLGRTGHAFYYQVLGLRPDLVAVGKALGAGVPVGAALVAERVATAVAYGDHGSTYGGNLLACRAALVFLEELVHNGLLERIAALGSHVAHRLRAFAERQSSVVEVRGAGLMWGLEVSCDAAAVVNAALRRRLLVNRTAGNVIRLLPPLTITPPEIDQALTTLEAALDEVCAGPPA